MQVIVGPLMVLFLFSILALLYKFIRIWMERNALKSQMESIAYEYARELFFRMENRGNDGV